MEKLEWVCHVQPPQSPPYHILWEDIKNTEEGTPRALWWLTFEAENAYRTCWKKTILEWPSGDSECTETKWPDHVDNWGAKRSLECFNSQGSVMKLNDPKLKSMELLDMDKNFLVLMGTSRIWVTMTGIYDLLSSSQTKPAHSAGTPWMRGDGPYRVTTRVDSETSLTSERIKAIDLGELGSNQKEIKAQTLLGLFWWWLGMGTDLHHEPGQGLNGV